MKNSRKIVLASQSPRRKELLSGLISDFEIVVDNSEENIRDGASPEEAAEILALQKAKNVAAVVSDNSIVIGADTMVSINGEIFGKPSDKEDAVRMLKILSGNENIVCTGIAVVDKTSGKVASKTVKTSVFFRNLTDEEIRRYVETGEPMDKAGGYGVQGLGSLLISGIHGDYFNVVGLPLCELAQMLKNEFGYEIL